MSPLVNVRDFFVPLFWMTHVLYILCHAICSIYTKERKLNAPLFVPPSLPPFLPPPHSLPPSFLLPPSLLLLSPLSHLFPCSECASDCQSYLPGLFALCGCSLLCVLLWGLLCCLLLKEAEAKEIHKSKHRYIFTMPGSIFPGNIIL